MSVYVDNMRAPYQRMRMSHMVADTLAELLSMATNIGVRHKWLQKPGQPDEHFDVCDAKRKLAIENGAEELSMMGVGRIIAAKRMAAARVPEKAE